MQSLIIHTDGGSRGNPGQAAIGVVFTNAQTQQDIHTIAKNIGIKTNNEAEYQAVIVGLQWLEKNQNFKKIEWLCDSLLVVKQLQRAWKIKEPRIRALAEEVWQLMKNISCPITFSHISREKNAQADALLNKELDTL